MARHQLDATVHAVTSAAYFLTSALSGMRSSELAELTSGWADHAENTQAVFLGNLRLSKPERARAQAAFDRATRIVAEIDTAGHTEEEPER